MTQEELRRLISRKPASQNASENENWRALMTARGLDPNAFYQEIEMSSPLVNTHRDITYAYEAMSLHSHAFYEILCCRSSCGAEYLVGQNRYSLQKGDILLIRPGVSHCAILPNPLTIPYERDILWLSKSFQDGVLKFLGLPPVSFESELPTYLFRTAGTPWAYLCDQIHAGVLEEEQKQELWQLSVLGNTLQLVAQFLRVFFSDTAQPLKAESPELLDQIIAYIEDHFQGRLVMTDVAKHFYISERTISALFRKRLGTTFIQFLTQRRLIAAKTLILEGVPMDLVAERSGFTNYSTFYRAFRKEFGISPNIFKNQKTAE